MEQDPFNKLFQKVKNGLNFEHRTLEYDPELQRIKQEILIHGSEINNMFLTKAEPFWRRVLLGEINEVFIFFSYNSYIYTWFIGREQKLYFEWKSDYLVKTENELSEEYFIWERTGNLKSPLPMGIGNIIQRAMANNQLPNPSFKPLFDDFPPSETTNRWGFPLDPKIGKLVITLNRLGVNTVGSCEGHPTVHTEYIHPHVSIPYIKLYPLLSLLTDLDRSISEKLYLEGISPLLAGSQNNEFFELIIKSNSLEEEQELAENLSHHLESKIANLTHPA